MRRMDLMDSQGFLRMIKGGYEELKKRKEEVNALNVFPVPDGDTGTNMFSSYNAGLAQLSSMEDETDLAKLTAAFSSGLLMGARGNSGVILSQLFRGFQVVFSTVPKVDPKLFANALKSGVEIAYKAVARPVEGTILTVAREAAHAAEAAAKLKEATFESVMRAALSRGEQALLHTPEQLPILRQAGVVDSGGQGLIYIYQGFLRVVSGVEFEIEPMVSDSSPVSLPFTFVSKEDHGEGEYGYCTEFIIRVDQPSDTLEQAIKEAMGELGDSLLVVRAIDLVKVHVHTLHPGSALERAMDFGSLTRIKIDNMTEQNQALTYVAKKELDLGESKYSEPQKRCGLAVIVMGDGLIEIFKSLGADTIVSDGSTMNPSTEEIVQAVQGLTASEIVLLTNNGNAVLAAEQARSVIGERLLVVPTTTIGAGLGAAIVYSADLSAKDNAVAMKSAGEKVKTGAITASARKTTMGRHEIGQGDYIGIVNGEITRVNSSRQTVLSQVVSSFCDEGAEICTIFAADVAALEEAGQIVRGLQDIYASVEFEVQLGGQPTYDYLLAVE